MRTIQRAGIIIGAVSCVALFLAQIGVALAVVWGIVLTGLATGLVVAKWLPRAWYGRQFEAGLRAGVLACVMGGAGALASQWIVGPHAVDALMQRSHVAFVDAAPLVRPLGFLGWAGADVLAIVLAAAAGVALAGGAAQAFALSKNHRTIRVVTRARQTALALSRDLQWESLPAPMTAGPALGSPASMSVPIPPERWLGRRTDPALAEVPQATAMRPGVLAPSSTPSMPSMPFSPGVPLRRATATPRRATASPRRSTLAPAPAVRPAEQAWAPERQPMPAPMPLTAASAETAASGDDDLTATMPSAPRRPKPRKTSSARPADRQLTQAMREALAAWADEADANTGEKAAAEPDKAPARRPPKPSTYLNSAGPAPKKRKRNDTRDWLC